MSNTVGFLSSPSAPSTTPDSNTSYRQADRPSRPTFPRFVVIGLLLTLTTGCQDPAPKAYTLRGQIASDASGSTLNLAEVRRKMLSAVTTQGITERYGRDRLNGEFKDFIAIEEVLSADGESGSTLSITVQDPTPARLAATFDWLDELGSRQRASAQQWTEYQSALKSLQKEYDQTQSQLADQRNSRESSFRTKDWELLKLELGNARDEQRLDVDAASATLDNYLAQSESDRSPRQLANTLREAIRNEVVPVSEISDGATNVASNLPADVLEQLTKWETRVSRLESSNYGDRHPALLSARRNLDEIREAMKSRVVENPFGAAAVSAKQSKLESLFGFLSREVDRAEQTEVELMSREGQLSSQLLGLRTQIEAQEEAIQHIARDRMPVIDIAERPQVPFASKQLDEFNKLRSAIN